MYKIISIGMMCRKLFMPTVQNTLSRGYGLMGGGDSFLGKKGSQDLC